MELQIREGVRGGGFGNGGGIDIDSRDMVGNAREFFGAVASAAAKIDDSFEAAEAGREVVAGEVFVEEIDVHFARDDAFTSKLSHFGTPRPVWIAAGR